MRNFLIILGIALTASAVALGFGLASDFVTFDETAHIAAGYSYLATGDFRMNPEHPPLVKMLAGLALAPLHPSVPTNTASWREYNEWDFGRQFLLDNRVPVRTLVTVARIPNTLLALGLVAAVAILAFRRFGTFGAVLTLAVSAFDPTLLAHGHLVTTDVPITLAFFGSVWSFTRFLAQPTRRSAALAVLLFSVAQLTKFSAILLVLFLPLLALFRWWQLSRAPGSVRWTHGGALRTVLLFLLVPLLLTMATYGFGVLRPRDDPRVQLLYQQRDELAASPQLSSALPLARWLVQRSEPGTRGRALIDRIATLPVPGYQYLRGQFAVLSHNYGGHGTFLLGQGGSRGWWYYFPVAFAVKTPSGTLILSLVLAIAGILMVRALIRSHSVRAALLHLPIQRFAFIAVPIAYVGWSLTSHLNLGVRHLLPVYPFLWLGIGSLAVVRVPLRFVRAWRTTLLAIALSVPFTTALDAPHFLPSFNTFAGGARNGTRYLADSNVDWGQDLLNLASELRRRGAVRPYVAYFGSMPLERFIPDAVPVPTDGDVRANGPPHGWLAISLNTYVDPNGAYRWLRAYRPVTLVGNSIALYRLP